MNLFQSEGLELEKTLLENVLREQTGKRAIKGPLSDWIEYFFKETRSLI